MRAAPAAVLAVMLAASVSISSDASAEAPAGVELALVGPEGRVRVQISEGLSKPCDATSNRMLFDGWASSGEVLRGTTTEDCVCVRHTSVAFPSSGWTDSTLMCRPRICRRRVCRPAPDPTIRATLPTAF